MKKLLLLGLIALMMTGCTSKVDVSSRAQTGQIGTDISVSREMAAKTIALAFYSNEELDKLDTELDFSDVSKED